MINSLNKSEFENKGFTLIKNFLDKEKVKKIKELNQDIIKKCEKGDWPFLSVYKDYPHFGGVINLFGVNYPLHGQLDKSIYNIVSKIEIESCIKYLLNWKNYKTTLIRLHAFNKNYNYQGAWHRDNEDFESQDTIQSVLYLMDESGFRIVPKFNNKKLAEYAIPVSGEEAKVDYMYRKLDKNMYESISAKSGDLFIFRSSLLHQGFSLDKRMHYHMRHEKSIEEISSISGLQFVDDYKSSANIEHLKTIYKGYTNSNSFKDKFLRFRVFVAYFFPRIKSLILNLFKKKNQKDYVLHNTIWQKK